MLNTPKAFQVQWTICWGLQYPWCSKTMTRMVLCSSIMLGNIMGKLNRTTLTTWVYAYGLPIDRSAYLSMSNDQHRVQIFKYNYLSVFNINISFSNTIKGKYNLINYNIYLKGKQPDKNNNNYLDQIC